MRASVAGFLVSAELKLGLVIPGQAS